MEPVVKGNTQSWMSWFRLPSGGKQWFLCKYYLSTETGDIVLLKRYRMLFAVGALTCPPICRIIWSITIVASSDESEIELVSK